jgi:multidrug efflux pump subunit AcrA (membrane-fusion protein)
MLRLAWATFVLAATATAAAIAGEPVEVPNMVIRLVEQVDAPARETGPLAVVNVTEGQLVTAGTLLAQIEDSDANLALERTKIELDVARRNAENNIAVRFAKKSSEVARAELQRCVDSVKKSPRSVSDSEMDRLRLLVEKGDLEIEQAQRDFVSAASSRQIKENEYKVALEKLKRHRVSAPIAGVVVRVYRNCGEWVKPGEPVVRILRLDRLRAEGFLKARDLVPNLQGRAVKLMIDLPNDPGHEFPGKITFVDPEVDPVNSQVRVWVEVLNQDLRLRPGMQAKMVIAPVASP